MKVKCIIIDDDKVFTQILEHYITKVDFLEHLYTFHNSAEAFNKIDFNDVDLIFLDMEMPDMHGLEFLDALKVKPQLVFVSRSKKYGPEAFENNAIDYLLKPISLSRFLKSSTKIKDHFITSKIASHTNNKDIFIKHEGLWLKLELENICIIKANNNSSIIVTEETNYQTNIKLKSISDKLPKEYFMRVHRSYIINLNKITRIDGETIEINSKTIPISKTYLNELYLRLNLT